VSSISLGGVWVAASFCSRSPATRSCRCLIWSVAELRTAWPDRIIETDFTIVRAVSCDRERVAQLFSNLLANASTHGAPDAPITTKAWIHNDFFELSVETQANQFPRRQWNICFSRFIGTRSDQLNKGSD
jgi:light-regulated signal transduction histidine kinase (bacteriophytochrome)